MPTMAWRSKALALGSAVVILAVVVAALVLRTQLRCAGFPGGTVSAAELPPAAPDGVVRVAQWNLRNFPLDERPPESDLGYSRRTNICDLEIALSGLDADILGLSEIRDPRRFPRVLRRATGRRYDLVVSSSGGRGGQRLGIAWDVSRFEQASAPMEIAGVAIRPTLRPAFAVLLRKTGGASAPVLVVQVHLKAGRDGLEDRRRQVRELITWLDSELERLGRPDVILQGDFNIVGGRGQNASGERRRVDAMLAESGLLRVPNADGCSQYWEGPGPRDGVFLPSLLDLVYLSGFDDWTVPEAESWLHCERMACADLISREGSEGATFYDVSDHCPVTVDLGAPREGSANRDRYQPQ